ncbi:hypothetical protein [Winogradskyella sp. PE311]|uniref:hypothetical protein n=1 Tax=Winogradskyella sp. PE311 TaxID=3366943 RepID=UPI00398166EF
MPSNSINIINYNRKQLAQRDKFVNRLGGYGKNRKPEYNFPKASPKQLRDIRQKLKKENQLLWIKIIGLSIVIIIALVWMLFAS